MCPQYMRTLLSIFIDICRTFVKMTMILLWIPSFLSCFSWHFCSFLGLLQCLAQLSSSCSVISYVLWQGSYYQLYSYYPYYYYFYYYYLSLLRDFHTSISWLFLPGVWVSTSLLKSPGLFSVFWPISIMQ